ncbi:MAG TPA: hypothetical protein PKV85_01750, partial [Spirochaetota bacterium]|nr:hypothetical protein [Spirochaetota bacterium]
MIHKIGFVFIVFFAVLGCGVDKNDPINLYNRYSKFENGLNFLSAKLDISSLENKNSFEISFSPNKIDVINLTPKSGLSNARISDGMISLNFKNGEK